MKLNYIIVWGVGRCFMSCAVLNYTAMPNLKGYIRNMTDNVKLQLCLGVIMLYVTEACGEWRYSFTHS
jgi:hypothetical protein